MEVNSHSRRPRIRSRHYEQHADRRDEGMGVDFEHLFLSRQKQQQEQDLIVAQYGTIIPPALADVPHLWIEEKGQNKVAGTNAHAFQMPQQKWGLGLEPLVKLPKIDDGRAGSHGQHGKRPFCGRKHARSGK
jgi:hypothetical protein